MGNPSEVVGHNIRRARHGHQLSQRALAAAMGKSQATVSRLENGLVRVRVDHLAALVPVLQVSASSFVAGMTGPRLRLDTEVL